MTRITDIPNLEGYGVFVDDVDFKNMSRREWMDLGKLHMEKLVMIIRKTGLQKQSFLQVMRKWGQDRQNYAATLFAKYPWAEGNVVKLIRSPELEQEDNELVECLLTDDSDLVGKSLMSTNFRQVFGEISARFRKGSGEVSARSWRPQLFLN